MIPTLISQRLLHLSGRLPGVRDRLGLIHLAAHGQKPSQFFPEDLLYDPYVRLPARPVKRDDILPADQKRERRRIRDLYQDISSYLPQPCVKPFHQPPADIRQILLLPQMQDPHTKYILAAGIDRKRGRVDKKRVQMRRLMFPRLLRPAHCLLHRLRDILPVDRLLHVPHRMQVNGRFEIFLVRIAGDKDDLDLRKKLPQLPAQHNAVLSGHGNIGHHDIRHIAFADRKRLLCVRRHPQLIDPQAFPFNMLYQPVTDDRFILHNHNLQTVLPPP